MRSALEMSAPELLHASNGKCFWVQVFRAMSFLRGLASCFASGRAAVAAAGDLSDLICEKRRGVSHRVFLI